MWVKVFIDVAGVMLISGAILLWLWLWDIVQNPEPWYQMPNLAGTVFFVSLCALVSGIYLLVRRERGRPFGREEDDATPRSARDPKPSFGEFRSATGKNTKEERKPQADGNKKHIEAIETALKLIARHPRDAASYRSLGAAQSSAGNYREAVKAYNRAIELGGDNAPAFNQRGVAYAQLGEGKRAIDDYDRAIKLDQKFADAFNNRGIVYKALGDHRRAIEDFNSAIRLDPEFAEAYALRGLAYGELGGNQSRNEDLKTAARLGSSFAQRYLNEKGIEW